MITVIGLIIGLMILCGGLYFFIKEKEDVESRKIYGIAAVVGIIVVVVSLLLR